ncbi:MAG: hypothetical protein ABI091_07060, partial [Ferruginibacter sp.]
MNHTFLIVNDQGQLVFQQATSKQRFKASSKYLSFINLKSFFLVFFFLQCHSSFGQGKIIIKGAGTVNLKDAAFVVTKDVSVSTTGSFSVNNGTLKLGGDISGNSNIYLRSGTLEMIGSSAQTIPSNTFYDNAVNNLVINNSSVSGVSLGGAVDVYRSLTYSGIGKILHTNDTLTLKSNINGTAWVGDLTGNTVSGKVTVERYITQYKAWRLLSIPTFSTQTIKEAWQENSTGGSSNPVPGFGTQITSPSASWAADGF